MRFVFSYRAGSEAIFNGAKCNRRLCANSKDSRLLVKIPLMYLIGSFIYTADLQFVI